MTNITGTRLEGSSLGEGLHVLRARWGWVVAIGIALILLGLVALWSVLAATVASVLTVGIMMIIAGAIEIVNAFGMKSWGKFFLWVIVGIFYGLAGVFVFENPVLAAGVFTLLLGAGLVASGIMRIILAFQLKNGAPWGWVAVSGLITLLVGVLILAQWPVSSLWVLGTFLGIDLLFAGVSWLVVGLALRRAA